MESVYENAFILELMEIGVDVESQKPINVYYYDHLKGEFRADLIVEDRVLVEQNQLQG